MKIARRRLFGIGRRIDRIVNDAQPLALQTWPKLRGGLRVALFIGPRPAGEQPGPVVGKEYYFLSGDGYLMPTRKDQPPPDPRYFKTAK